MTRSIWNERPVEVPRDRADRPLTKLASDLSGFIYELGRAWAFASCKFWDISSEKKQDLSDEREYLREP